MTPPPTVTPPGIGSLPAWLASEPIPDEMLPPDSAGRVPDRRRQTVRDLLDEDAGDFGIADLDAPDPDAAPRHRVLPAPPAALALVVVGILAVVVAAVLFVRGAPADIGPVAFPSSAGPTAPTAKPTGGSTVRSSAAESTTLVISVVGLVRRPGLVKLPPQARVADAITAAGGARPGADLLSLNLARPLHDGDQIIVGLSGDGNRAALRSAVIGVDDAPVTGQGGPAPRTGSASNTPAGKVNLNTATEAELDALPGVGPVTAAAIIEWRNRNGRFASVDQLAEVDGIGPGRLAKLRDRVVV